MFYKLPKFEDFLKLLEEDSVNADTAAGRAADVVNSIAKFYTTQSAFPTNASAFSTLEEKRDWESFRTVVKVGEDVDVSGKYKIDCQIDEIPYLVEVEFSAKIFGQMEKDIPEPIADDGSTAVQLKKLTISKAFIKSPRVKYSTNDLTGLFLEAVINLLEAVLITDYDIKGAEIYSLQKTQ